MKRLQCLCLVLLLMMAGSVERARADVKMPAIFGSQMVLQREIKVPVWGTADAGEKVTVCFAGQKVATEAGSDGKWKVTLAPMAASARPRELKVSGKNTLTFEDVLVGDVWICSGQSNMWWSASNGIKDQEQEIQAAKYPRIRMIIVPMVAAAKPQANFDGKLTPKEDFDGHWDACTPEVMKTFSAVGYFFGRNLHQRLDVPIGLIGTYWGGTPAQAWTSREALEADAQLKVYFQQWADQAKNPIIKNAFYFLAPTLLYNGMIAPLIPFAIRGAIWYQGESNAMSAEDSMLYHRLFSTMIADWRTRWGQGDFPFFFVQLAAFMQRWEQPGDSRWALLRESQTKTLALPATGMAVTIDVGEAANIHPKNKQVVGRRLALAALKTAYGRDVELSGPAFDRMEVLDNHISLHFTHLGGGLVSKAKGGVKGFAVAGSDKKFYWAAAKIVGDTVVVSSPHVPDPLAVRYGWADNPEVSLYNAAGLPAIPFRTDTWEVRKMQSKPVKPAVPAKK